MIVWMQPPKHRKTDREAGLAAKREGTRTRFFKFVIGSSDKAGRTLDVMHSQRRNTRAAPRCPMDLTNLR